MIFQKQELAAMRTMLNPLGIIDVIGGGITDTRFYQHGTALQCKQQFDKMGWNWNSYTKFLICSQPMEKICFFNAVSHRKSKRL